MSHQDLSFAEKLEQLTAAELLVLGARSLLRFLPYFRPDPESKDLAGLAVGTVEAISYRAVLGVVSTEPTGHRSAAKTASALFPENPGRLLSEATTAWESGSHEVSAERARREILELAQRAEGQSWAQGFLQAGDEDLRLLHESGEGRAPVAILTRPLYPAAAAERNESDLVNWGTFLSQLGLSESVGRRFREILNGSFPGTTSLLLTLDAWARWIESLPAERRAERRGTPTEEAPDSSVQSLEVVGRFTALSEAPADRDLLGRQPLVDALAAMCADRDQGTPFALALLGDWGAGKSSAMHLLRQKLRADPANADRFVFAWFNAWEYENTGNMAAALAQEIVGGLVADLKWWAKLRLRARFAARQHPRGVAWAMARLLAAALSLPAVTWVLSGSEPLTQSFIGVGLAAGLGAFVIALRRDIKQLWEHPLAVELRTFLKLPDYGEHLGFLPIIKRHLRILLDLRLGTHRNGRRRLVCFVDDLDRCGPQTIVRTLEAVRLVVDEKDCIIVLGVDHRIALAAITEHYRHLEAGGVPPQLIARDYLGKVVQLVIRLEPLEEHDLDEFIIQRLFPLAREEQVRLAKPAPRAAALTTEPSPPPATPPPGGASSEPPPSSSDFSGLPIDLTQAMKHSDGERVLFRSLAVEQGFSNPRQLLRLRNSYRLLRLLEAQLAIDPGWSRLPSFLLMRALFWQEFLNQYQRKIRGMLDFGLVALRPPAELPDDLRERVSEASIRLRCLLRSTGATQVAWLRSNELASRFVLPNGD